MKTKSEFKIETIELGNDISILGMKERIGKTVLTSSLMYQLMKGKRTMKSGKQCHQQQVLIEKSR